MELFNSRVRAGASSLVTTWRRQQSAAFLGFRFSSNLYTPFSMTVVSGIFFLFIQLNDHDHQVHKFVTLVHAGYLCVAKIHQILTWTTGSLTCVQMLMHAIAQGGVGTLKVSLCES